MENHSFWTDLLATYQTQTDFIKALWLVIPPSFVVGIIALLRPRGSNDGPTSSTSDNIEKDETPIKKWRVQGGVFPHLVEVDDD